MNESFEINKPVDKYIEGAMRSNEYFVTAIDEARDLNALARVISEFTFIDESGDGTVFEIVEKPGEEVDARTYSEDELLSQIDAVGKNFDLTKQDIIEMVEHSAVAQALIRILEK